jgi:hypothetical protein
VRLPLRDGQIFIMEKRATAGTRGPGLVFIALMPDLNYFGNRGAVPCLLSMSTDAPTVPAATLKRWQLAFLEMLRPEAWWRTPWPSPHISQFQLRADLTLINLSPAAV